MTTKHHHIEQHYKDLKGPADNHWTYMVLYWTIGWIVGLWKDYLSQWTFPTPTLWHWGALLMTLLIQQHINERYDNFGRRRDYIGIACFAVFNGMAETMLFLATYDYGRIKMARKMGLSSQQAIAMGFFSYFMYNAVIQLFFWKQYVYPQHVRPDAPPFYQHTLPAVMVLSMIWLTLYEVHGDVSTICLLHILVDFWTGTKVAYPLLFGP